MTTWRPRLLWVSPKCSSNVWYCLTIARLPSQVTATPCGPVPVGVGGRRYSGISQRGPSDAALSHPQADHLRGDVTSLAGQPADMDDKTLALAGSGLISDRQPLRFPAARVALERCVARTVILLLRRQVQLPGENVGMRLRFADETSARVYRETVVDQGQAEDPCALVVEFRLRAVRGWGHAVFRWESLLNTPLFVGFPGVRLEAVADRR